MGAWKDASVVVKRRVVESSVSPASIKERRSIWSEAELRDRL